MAQPSDLKSKIPGEDVRAEQAAALAVEPSAAAGDAAVAANTELDSLITDMMGAPDEELDVAQATPDPTELDTLSDDELFQQLFQETEELNLVQGENADALGLARPGDERPIDMGRELAVRASASLALNPKQKMRLVERALGSEFAVSERDGEILFRKKGSKKAFKLDPEGFEGGLREILADVFADNAEVILETLAATGVELPAAATGFMLGGPAGATGGAILAAPAASRAAVEARDAALSMFEESYPTEEMREAYLMGGGLNAVTAGAGALVSASAKQFGNLIKPVLQSSPKRVLEESAKIRQGFEGFRNLVVGPLRETRVSAGEQIGSAVESIHGQLGKKLGLLRDDFVTKSGGKKYPAEGYAAQLQEALNRAGIDAQQTVLLTRGKQAKQARAEVLRRLEQADAFGNGEAGAAFVGKLLDEVEFLNKNGGLTAQELLDKAQFWKQPAGFSRRTGQRVPIPSETQRYAGNIRRALSEDELGAFQEAFVDQPDMGAYLQSAKNDFSDRIEAIRNFRKVFDNKDSGERFLDAITRNKRDDLVRDMKFILGEDSNEWQLVRAAWFDGIHKKALDPASGLVKPGQIGKMLDQAGEGVVNQMLTQEQVSVLKLLDKKSLRVPLLTSGQAASEQFLKDATAVTFLNYNQPGIITRALWTLSRNNADVARYLADEGLLDVATTIKNPRKKANAFKAIELFKAKVNAAKETMEFVSTERGKRQVKVLREISLEAAEGPQPVAAAAPGRGRPATAGAVGSQAMQAGERAAEDAVPEEMAQ